MKSLIFLFIAVVILASLPACSARATEEPPGVGEKAERGYAVSEPVIAALEQYKADKGFYPETLAELVPEYLSVVPTKDGILDFSYTRTETGYSFSFHYIGPGMNTCTHTPENGWKCSGAH
jgi:hypothetical protein